MKQIRMLKAFSFVEIIIAISILALLSVVGTNYYTTQKINTVNTKISTDLGAINNALLAAQSITQNFVHPSGNTRYYSETTGYMHSTKAEDAYGISGFMTEETLAKQFLDILPLDPRNNQYYAYGLAPSLQQYELSWIIMNGNDPQAYVVGNYEAETWPVNLIKEYNGPNYVNNWSQLFLPYNPDERVMTASIFDYEWVVSINNANMTPEQITNHVLRAGDKIVVEKNWYAEIYFSDGSKTILWENDRDSELTITKMEFKSDTNLITDVKLALSAGTIWNKAPKLENDSEFEIFAGDTKAAVRWTVYWVTKHDGVTNVTVTQGKVDVEEVYETGQTEIKETLEVTTQNPESYTKGGTAPNKALNMVPEIIKKEVKDLTPEFNNSLKAKILAYNKELKTVELEVNDIFKTADFIVIKTDAGNSNRAKESSWETGATTIDIASFITNDYISFKFGKRKKSNPADIIYSAETILYPKNAVAYTELNSIEIEDEDEILEDFHEEENEKEIENETDNLCALKILLLWKKVCIKNTLLFPKVSDEKWELVATAPYNYTWDLNLYTEDDTILPSQQAIYENSTPLPSQCINGNSNSILSPNSSATNWLAGANIFNNHKKNSFCTNKDNSETGIFIDNSGSNSLKDYLKYKELDSKLRLWENYIVEMDFDWKTLQSWWGKYLLSNRNGPFVYVMWNTSNDNIFQININGDKKTKLWSNHSGLFLDNKKIYTVYLKRTANISTLYIYDKINKTEIYNSGPVQKTISLNQLNIGSSSTFGSQLNGIIYNLKLYKKK